MVGFLSRYFVGFLGFVVFFFLTVNFRRAVELSGTRIRKVVGIWDLATFGARCLIMVGREHGM